MWKVTLEQCMELKHALCFHTDPKSIPSSELSPVMSARWGGDSSANSGWQASDWAEPQLRGSIIRGNQAPTWQPRTAAYLSMKTPGGGLPLLELAHPCGFVFFSFLRAGGGWLGTVKSRSGCRYSLRTMRGMHFNSWALTIRGKTRLRPSAFSLSHQDPLPKSICLFILRDILTRSWTLVQQEWTTSFCKIIINCHPFLSILNISASWTLTLFWLKFWLIWSDIHHTCTKVLSYP